MMKRVLAAVVLGLGLTAGIATASFEDEIRARIAPIGEVCLQGDNCGTAAPVAAASSGPRSGDEVYAAVCQACHAAGVAGAPKIGDTAAWAPRIGQGMEMLFDHSLTGLNAMPAKGGCASCADEEVKAAVEYMVSESK